MRLLNFYFDHYRHFSLAVWLNIVAVLVNACGVMMSFFIALYLVNELHYSVTQMGWILGMGSVGGIVGSYCGGWLADRFNHVRISQVMLLLSALQNFLIPVAHSYWAIVTMIFLLNVFIYGFRPANTLVLFAHCELVDRTRVFALYRTAFNLGLVVAIVIGGALAKISFHYFFWFSGLMNLFSAGLLWYWHSILVSKWVQREHSAMTSVWSALYRSRYFLLLTFLFLLNTLIFSQMRSTYGVYLNQYDHLTLQHMGFLFTINMAGIVLLEVPLMSWLKRVDPLYLAMIGNALIASGMAILPIHAGLTTSVISIVLWTAGEILSASPFYVLAMRYADPRYPGFYMGVFQMAMTVGVVFAPIVGGTLYPLYDGKILWYGCGVLGLLMCFGFLRLHKNSHFKHSY